PGFELVVVDQDTPAFYEAVKDAEYVMGLGRPIAGEFFRSAPKLKLVQLLSAGYDRVDIESARKAKVPVANNGGANAIAVSEHAMMKKTAILVNTCRGPVVDEAALHKALTGGQILAAGLDVLVEEPAKANHPLYALKNVTLTPHSAGPTWENWAARFRNGFDN